MSVDEYSEQLSPPPLHLPLENLLHDKNTNSTILRATRYKITCCATQFGGIGKNPINSAMRCHERGRKNGWRENLSHRIQCWAVCVEHLAFVLCKKDEERCHVMLNLCVCACGVCVHTRVCVVNAECTRAFVMCKIPDRRRPERQPPHLTFYCCCPCTSVKNIHESLEKMIIYCFWCWPFTSVLIFMLRCRCYWIKCTSKVPMLSIRWCCPGRQDKQPSLSSCNIIFLTSPMESPCTHNWFFIKCLVLPTGQCPGQHDMTSNCLSPVELFTKSWPFILSSPTLDMRVNMLHRQGRILKGWIFDERMSNCPHIYW